MRNDHDNSVVNKTALTIVLLVLVLAGGFLVFSVTNDSPTPDDTDLEQEQVSVPEDWQRYESETFDFSIAYPPGASLQREAENHIKFSYLGPDNQPASEITDGFTFTVSVYDLNEDQTLKTFARTQLQKSLQIAEKVRGLEQATLNGLSGYTYATESLGTVQHLVIPHTGSRAVIISYNISDPNNRSYQAIVNSMLASFELLPPSEERERASGQARDTLNLTLYRNDLGNYSFRYSADKFVVRTIMQHLPPDNSDPPDSVVKLIPRERVDLLGREECMYGLRGIVELCTAQKEDGIGIAVISESLASIEAKLDPTVTDPVEVAGRQGIRYAIGAEGFGGTYYFIPLGEYRTAVVYRTYSPQTLVTENDLQRVLSTITFNE